MMRSDTRRGQAEGTRELPGPGGKPAVCCRALLWGGTGSWAWGVGGGGGGDLMFCSA